MRKKFHINFYRENQHAYSTIIMNMQYLNGPNFQVRETNRVEHEILS